MIDLPPPDPAIEIVVASQGMSKGLRQTDGPQVIVRPSLQIGRVSIGAYGKNITSPSAEGEGGIFLGYSTRIGGVQLSPVISYKRLLERTGRTDADAWEFGLSMSRQAGRITPYLSLYYSPDELGSTGESLYAEAGASLRLSPSFTINTSVAHRVRAGGPDYGALSAGISHQATRNISLDLRYHDTDRGDLGAIYQRRLVASLRARF